MPILEKLHANRRAAFTTLAVLFIAASVVSYFIVKDAVNKTIEEQALTVAEIVATQATTSRSVYASKVASKLEGDGFGPHVDYKDMPGFVPIPAQFLKMVGLASAENAEYLYHYKPVSRWNLEETQGLGDDFLLWAWPQLEQQDQPEPSKPIQWEPVSRFETQNGKRVLRYLSADPASQMSCINCHNSYEKRPEVMAMRVSGDVPLGKEWKQHQLLGALSITIPLDKVEHVAASQVHETTTLIFAILAASFISMIYLSSRLLKQETNLRQTEKQLLASEQQTREARILLKAKQGVERAFAELSTYLSAIDEHALVSITDPGGRIIQANNKFCEVSGYNLGELIGEDHRIINASRHPASLFAELWRTIAAGNIWRGEICNVSKQGQHYWVDSAIVPLKDEKGDVIRYISIGIDITPHKVAERRMAYMATHDALTGLPNRNLLHDRIQQAIASDRRRNEHAALMFIDLDYFKGINDSLGHDIGDEVLIEVARRISSCMREEDTVARQGGDEFIVLLPNLADAQSADVFAQKLLNRLSAPYMVNGQTLHISASIGIAVFPFDGDNPETLLKHCDIAMYHAKELGRNTYQFFTPSMNEEAAERHELSSTLRQAVANNELVLYFQPIVENASGHIVSMEVLLRWKHPSMGFITPARFISVAEETGLILALDEWVLRTACLQWKAWRDAGHNPPKLAINFSAKQFRQPGFVAKAEAIFAETGVPPSCIEIEITEGVLMGHSDDTIDMLKKLKSMGMDISVDDFGTGYSSLSYLKRLPLDTIKIDRGFISDVATNPEDAAIVAAIITLAHSLHIHVVAEGVETAAQLSFLRNHSCDRFQGYFFSKPVIAAHAAALFLNAGRTPPSGNIS